MDILVGLVSLVNIVIGVAIVLTIGILGRFLTDYLDKKFPDKK